MNKKFLAILLLLILEKKSLPSTLTYQIAFEPQGTTSDITLYLPTPKGISKKIAKQIKREINKEIKEYETIEKEATKYFKGVLAEFRSILKIAKMYCRIMGMKEELEEVKEIEKSIERLTNTTKRLKKIKVGSIKTPYGEMLMVYVPGKDEFLHSLCKKEFNFYWKGEIPFSLDKVFEITPTIPCEKEEIFYKTCSTHHTITTSLVPIYVDFKGEGVKMKIRYFVKTPDGERNYFIGYWEILYRPRRYMSSLADLGKRLIDDASVEKPGWHILSMAEETYSLTRKKSRGNLSIFWPYLDRLPPLPSPDKMRDVEMSNKGKLIQIIIPDPPQDFLLGSPTKGTKENK